MKSFILKSGLSKIRIKKFKKNVDWVNKYLIEFKISFCENLKTFKMNNQNQNTIPETRIIHQPQMNTSERLSTWAQYAMPTLIGVHPQLNYQRANSELISDSSFRLYSTERISAAFRSNQNTNNVNINSSLDANTNTEADNTSRQERIQRMQRVLRYPASIHPNFRTKAVCELFCRHCSAEICKRGMKAILLANTRVEL